MCWRCPSDIAHDIYERFGCTLIRVTVNNLVSNKLFSVQDLNSIIKSFPYSDSDKVNKPVPLSTDGSSKVSVKQTSAQCLCLLRLLPLMISHYIPNDNECWKIYIKFLQILDFILAPSLDRGQLKYLEIEIQMFLEDFYAMHTEENVRPKAHYLLHYPRQYEVFGPLVNNITLRYEGKHSYFKNIMRKTKNFKSPLLTMATHHQYMQCLYLQNSDYLPPPSRTFRNNVKKATLEENILDAVDSFTPDLADTLQYYASVDCDGIKYTSNQAVVLNNMNSNSEFRKIICCTSVYGEVVLITHVLQTEYYSQMHNAFVVRQDSYPTNKDSVC